MNSRQMLRNLGLGLALSAMLIGTSACSKGAVVRYKLPNGAKFPISMGVEIPAGNNIIFLSGMTPPVSDFAGMMEGYTQFFGTVDQPNLPSRSAMQVAALANPGFLVEIEVAAVRP